MTAHLGVILAGGLARRMGGVDKPLVELGGKPLLAHLVERLAPQCVAGLILNANGDPARFAAFGLPVIADTVEGFAGPLAGVLAGMEHAAGKAGVTHVVTVPGDTPFIPQDLVTRLDDARWTTGAEIAVAASGGRVHHAVAMWPVGLLSDLRRALKEEGERRVSAYIARHGNVAVEWPDTPSDPFFNVNRTEDLEAGQG